MLSEPDGSSVGSIKRVLNEQVDSNILSRYIFDRIRRDFCNRPREEYGRIVSSVSAVTQLFFRSYASSPRPCEAERELRP